MKFSLFRSHLALDIVARRHAIRIEVLGSFQKVFEFHPLIATNARHRGRTSQITICELVNHRIFKHVLIVQNVMGKAHFLGHAARIMDIEAGTARTLLGQSRTMIIKLQRYTDHVIALGCQLRRNHRTIHTARHRHDNAGI